MTTKTFFQWYGYDIEIHVGSRLITTKSRRREYGLSDTLTITSQENVSRTAKFTFIPPEAIINLERYQGQAVKILIKTAADGWQQVFTGYVDVPSLDFIAKKVTLVCNDNRANQIIKMPYSAIQSVGLFNESLFGTPSDQNEELEKRLQTVTASFDFDNHGNPTLTPWTPKVTPDFTFTSIDVRQKSNPSILYTSRKATINTINLTARFNYQRLHQQCAFFVWNGYTDFIIDWWNQGKPSFPTRDQISAAINSASWVLINPTQETNFVPIWPAGVYRANGAVIIWQPNEVITQYKQKTEFTGWLKDSTGNFVTAGDPPTKVPQYSPVVDSSGNPVMIETSKTIIDTSSALCRGVNFQCALRFAQNISEEYRVTISAPQSVAKYGVINRSQSINVTESYDSSTWENSKVMTAVSANFYIDAITDRVEIIKAIQVSYAKAKHDILEVHRDVNVQFQTQGLRPKLDLKHTVDFTVEDPRSDTAHIHAKGKVSAIVHTIDFVKEEAYTDVTLSLSRSDGIETDSNFTVNIATQNPGYIGNPKTIILGTHLGLDPNHTPGADKWTGWIGNKNIGSTAQQNTRRTTYTESFVIDFPAIPDNVRKDAKYFSDTSLDVAIPNDTLETST